MPVFSSFSLRGSALDGSLKVATVTIFIARHYTALLQNQPSRRPVLAPVHPQIVGSWERGLQAASAWARQRIWRVQPTPGNERHRSAVNGALRYREHRDAPALRLCSGFVLTIWLCRPSYGCEPGLPFKL